MKTILTATTARTAVLSFLALTAIFFSSGCGLAGQESDMVGFWEGTAKYDYKLDGENYSAKTKHAAIEVAPTEDGVVIIIENFAGEGHTCTLFAEVDEDKFEIERSYCHEWEGDSLFVQGDGEVRGGDELELDIEFEYETAGIIYASGQVKYSLDKM